MFHGDTTGKPSDYRAIKHIRVTAKIKDSRNIGFISESGPSSRTSFTEMSVHIRAASDEMVESGRNGNLPHMTGAALQYGDHDKPHLALELYVPQSNLDMAWTAVRHGVASRMDLCVYVAVFQSEVERALAEPWMHQTYYIEDKSLSAVTFESLTISYPKLMRKPIEPKEGDIDLQPVPERSEDPLVTVLRRNVAAMNLIARYLKIVAGGVVAVAALLVIALLR